MSPSNAQPPEPGGGPRLSRRRLLGGAAAGGLGWALSGAAGRLIEAAAATQSPCRSLEDIQHVVILIMENRSFDHLFGTYRGVAGFSDPKALRQAARGDRSVFYQYGWGPGDTKAQPGHYLNPFHLDTTDLRTDAECINDITHAWGAQHMAWNAGAMDRWVSTHVSVDGIADGPSTMGFYTRKDLGFLYGLADAFTVCDSYHCSVLGPTVPNRLYSISATIDPDGSLGGGPVVDNPATGVELVPGGTSANFAWQTMPQVLQEAGVSWKVYNQPGSQSTDALSDTVLYYFPAFRDPASPLFQKAMLPSFPGDLQADVAAGTLPSVSWVVPMSPLDEHPPAPVPLGDMEVTHQVLATLMSNPAVWESTVVFVTYDENGGFFDHVAPPTAPRGTPGEWLGARPAIGTDVAPDGTLTTGPIGLGFRVPMLVVSPYSVGGLVCSDVFDHTSTLRFIESRFGTPVPNLSPWRRAHTGDLTSAINFAAGARPSPTGLGALMATATTTAADAGRMAAQCAQMGVYATEAKPYPVPLPQSVPTQEPGVARRPSGPRCRG